ncbi:hypothetical protein VST32_07210, partial [Pseudomonas aeruginosa]|uniref:hypothetical protein n=1 Tax=Pseudomonas aeruginosa TaxID=287 RepID=UPI003982D555
GLTLFLQISQSLWIFYPSLSRHRSEYPGFISPIPLQLSHSLSSGVGAAVSGGGWRGSKEKSRTTKSRAMLGCLS